MSFLNTFDYDENEASQIFQQVAMYGTSPDLETADDFLKKSMASANMNTVKFSDDYSGTNFPEPISTTNLNNTKATQSKDEFNERSAALTFSARGRVNPTTVSKSEKYIAEDSVISAAPKHAYTDRTANVVDGIQDINCNVHFGNEKSGYVKKLEKELAEAKRMICMLKNEKWKTVPVKETIGRIVNGDPVVFDGYKSLANKVELLKNAVKSCDGNAIITVISFLEKSLSARIFHAELRKYPSAISHYIQYLRSNEEWTKLEDLYKYLLLVEDAAILRYERVNQIKYVKERVIGLHKWLNDYGEKIEAIEIKNYVYEEVKLLERQQQLEMETKSKDVSVVMIPNIKLTPLLSTISFCALHHYEKGSKHHPGELKKLFNVSGKQYEFAVIVPLATHHRWTDMEDLFVTSNWIGKKTIVSHTGFENIVNILHKAKASNEIISKYCCLISNLETRIEFAKKMILHDVVIDTLVQLKDRRRMEDYRVMIGDSSRNHTQKIIDLLRNTSIKWR